MYIGVSVLVGYVGILPIISSCTDGDVKSILYYLHALGVSLMIYVLLHGNNQSTTNSNEIYGLRHLLFNLELPPKTLWFNMGLWDQPNLTFPQACENLVHAVAKFMDIQPKSKILDVGFGCGDSCLVLAEKYQSNVTGITNELSQWRIATDRLTTNQQKESIQLLHGSADDLDKHIKTNDMFDHIISIDSAYHYNTRWDFLKAAFHHIKPQGSVGLYDLCIDAAFIKNASPMQHRVFKFLCDAVHIPIKNLVTVEEYGVKLKDMGYTNVELLSLDRQQVFGGLAASFDKQYDEVMKYGIGVSLSNRCFLKVSSYLFGLLGAKPWLVPIIVKGEK